jgi:hypothetical protein
MFQKKNYSYDENKDDDDKINGIQCSQTCAVGLISTHTCIYL